LRERVHFQRGTAESLSFDAATLDLVWCKDVLIHVAALGDAYGEFRRVLRDNGHVVLYQSCFVTEPLTRREQEWLESTPGFVPGNADPERTEAAIADAGLRIDDRIDVGIEWREWSEEQTGHEGRQLLHTARLLRDPDGYRARFGRTAYDIMLGDCLWHVYHMIGKVGARVYVLSLRG
jgi:SAM-dependent methyltransferase